MKDELGRCIYCKRLKGHHPWEIREPYQAKWKQWRWHFARFYVVGDESYEEWVDRQW